VSILEESRRKAAHSVNFPCQFGEQHRWPSNIGNIDICITTMNWLASLGHWYSTTKLHCMSKSMNTFESRNHYSNSWNLCQCKNKS
jgi:hypothetical protein